MVEQTSRGVEADATFTYGNFSMMTSVGYMDVDVEEQDGFNPVAPLTPDLTLAIGPQYTFELDGGIQFAYMQITHIVQKCMVSLLQHLSV